VGVGDEVDEVILIERPKRLYQYPLLVSPKHVSSLGDY
jgi:hypothetical protein